MRKVYYALRQILRASGMNLIKVISLALGLTVSIILFTRIAFDLDYDRFYKDSDRLYQIKAGYRFNENEQPEPKTTIGGKFAGAVAESFPDEVESATVVRRWEGHTLYNGNMRFAPFMIVADTLFFRTMGLEVVKGNPQVLAQPDRLFISEALAGRAFGREDPIGKVMMYERTTPMIVSGIYKDVPENNSIGHYEAVISFATLVKNEWSYIGWDGGDIFLGYARLKDKKAADKVNQRIDQAISTYLPPTLDFSYKTEIVPIRRIHTDIEDVRRMLGLMGILALVILLSVTLNYVLIAISSLAHRAKAIGIHKCNGASGKDILGMFFIETGILIGLSGLLMAALLSGFQDWIEEMIDVPFRSLFSINHIWAPAGVVLFLLIAGSLIPGRIFSSVSVSRIFRRVTDGKRNWKRLLLFVQFMGFSFMSGLLGVVWMQYHHITHKDLGYSPERVAYVSHRFKHPDNARTVLLSLPFVDEAASSGLPLVGGYKGWMGVTGADGATGFSPRYTTYDKDYLSFMNLKLKAGRSVSASGEIMVNETFVKQMRWTDNPVGQFVDRYGTVVGVMEDFASDDLFLPMEPVAVACQEEFDQCVHVRLKAPFKENLRRLNETMQQVFPDEDVLFLSLEEELLKPYKPVRQFGQATQMASVTILFLILMGLLGYTNDEVYRRSKEIAIRKVNGAEVHHILAMFSKDILYIALPSVLLGVGASWYVSRIWIEMFAEQMPLGTSFFTGIGALALAVIVGCVLAKSWRIANENPVNNIKNE
jgi:putative ABC transport system permease protein